MWNGLFSCNQVRPTKGLSRCMVIKVCSMYRSKVLQDRLQQAMTNMYDNFQSNESILLHDFFNDES